MSDHKNNSKPTSPHLQIYRWNISSIASIMHRLTGVALYFSILAIAWFIVYYTYNIGSISEKENCECASMLILNIIFYGAIIAITFSLYYHFCNGIRHLFWDIGKGFNVKTANRNAVIVILSALALTIASIATVVYLKLF